MSQYQVQQTAVIEAPAERLYQIIADYRQGHPSILPAQYFTGLTVKRGGFGAGTALSVEMNVYGTRASYELEVSEPEPGRMLVEEDKRAGVRTTFTVDPVDGRQSRVTISTTAATGSGLKGVIERLVNPSIMRRIYREELRQLAKVAAEPSK